MNKLLKFYAVLVVASCYVSVLGAYTVAYFNDVNVLITINDYGEANIENVMLAASLVIFLKWGFHLLNRKVET